jgi:hypothetical protein
MEIERVKINQEKEKWKTREKEIIEQLLDFQNKAYDLMESFQSEINYLTSKELILTDSEDNDSQTRISKDLISIG